MEEDKVAAYYDELTRTGGGAARFKQGLGFSSSSSSLTGDSNHSDAVPARGSALPSSSFLSSFVRASGPSKSSDVQKQAQIESIQNKLKRKHNSSSSPRVSDDHSRGREESDRHSSRRRRSRSRSRDHDERSRNRRRCSRDRYTDRDRDRDGNRDRDSGRTKRSTSRSRSLSPRRRRSEKIRYDHEDDRNARKEKSERVDHAKSIEGYDKMSPAERVKAKMKLQLSATAKQDEANGMGSGWERFNFDKDAPLDDEEIEG